MQKNRYTHWLVVILLAVCANSLAVSRTLADPPDWAKDSDVICVALCKTVQDTNEPWHYDKDATYKTKVATFEPTLLRVRHTVGQDLKVKLHSLGERALWEKGITTYSYPIFFSGFQPNHVYLLLLKNTSDGGYGLTEPYYGTQSAIELVATPTVNFDQPIPSWLIKAVIPSLSSPNAEVQRGVLAFLAGFKDMVVQNTPDGPHDLTKDPTTKDAVAALRTAAIPAIIPLTQSAEQRTQLSALAALANLQYPGVIPSLADHADGKFVNYDVAVSALRSYQSNSAAALLWPLLTERPAAVRRAASYSLRLCIDPKAVPILIKALQDPDIEVRYNAVCALYANTGKMPPVAYRSYPAKENEYRVFWSKWKPAD